MSATINSKASLFSSSNCQIRRDNRFPAVSNRCRSVRVRPVKAKCSLSCSNSRSDILGRRVSDLRSQVNRSRGSSRFLPVRSQINGNLRIGNAPKWWEKNLQPNMREVSSAQDLVDSLRNAGDNLVVVDFFSPGCGGCRALHPKICQIAGMNPDVQFLQVNYEEHKSMCYSLNVHVLPFFRFYRGAEGRVCSFSCTNATIKKFRDALAKYGPDRCSFGPPKGLEEKELLALSANKDLSFTYTPKRVPEKELAPAAQGKTGALPFPMTASAVSQEMDKKMVINSGR